MMTFKTSIHIVIVLMLLIFSGSAYSQNSNNKDSATVAPELKTKNSFLITESDFSCFRDLNCLKENKSIREGGLEIDFDEKGQFKQYKLEGESRNERVYALYNSQGGLMEGRLARINIALPRFITEQVASGQYTGWRMIGNEWVVENFDARTTRYKVILQKEDQGTVLYFDRHGNQINLFAGF